MSAITLKARRTSPLLSREEDGEQKSSRPAWAVTSIVGIGLSCVVSVTVPFFDIIVAAIGALGDLAAAYALPALFVLASSPAPWLHHAEITLLRLYASSACTLASVPRRHAFQQACLSVKASKGRHSRCF